MLYSNFNEDQEFFDSYLTQPIENSDYFNSIQYINKCGPGFSISDDLKEHYSNVDNIENNGLNKNSSGGLDNGSGGSGGGLDNGSGGGSSYGSSDGSDYGSDYRSDNGSSNRSNYRLDHGSDYGLDHGSDNRSNHGSDNRPTYGSNNGSNYESDNGSNNKSTNKSNIKQIGNKIISNAKSFFNIEKIKLFIIYLLSGIIIILIIHLWYRMQIIINNNCIKSRK